MVEEDSLQALRDRLHSLVAIPKVYAEFEYLGFRDRFARCWSVLAQRIARTNASPRQAAKMENPWKNLNSSITSDEIALKELIDECGISAEAIDLESDILRLKDELDLRVTLSRGSESCYFEDECQIDIESSREALIEDIKKIERWIGKLRDKFNSIWKPWIELKYLSSDEYKKHFPNDQWSKEAVVRYSNSVKNGEFVSMFYPGITRDALLDHFWRFLDDNWEFIKKAHVRRFVEDVGGPIGASKGRETNCILWDLDCSQKYVHSFPILKSDISNVPKILGRNDLAILAEG